MSKKYGFQFIVQKNQGLPTVLNNGLQVAKSKYFVAIGSDDVCMLDRIEKQVEYMESRDDISVCAGNCLVIDEDGVPVKSQKFITPRELTFDHIFLRKNAEVPAPTVMCRTEIMRQVGGYNPNIKLEDIYMWLKITSTGSNIYVMGDVLAYYRKHSGNQSKNMTLMADGLEKIYSEYSQNPNYERTINKLLINLFAKSVRRGYPQPMKLFKRISPRYYNSKLILMLLLWLIKLPLNAYK